MNNMQNCCCFSMKKIGDICMYVWAYVYMYTLYMYEHENDIIVLNDECTNEPIIAGTRRISGIGGTGL